MTTCAPNVTIWHPLGSDWPFFHQLAGLEELVRAPRPVAKLGYDAPAPTQDARRVSRAF